MAQPTAAVEVVHNELYVYGIVPTTGRKFQDVVNVGALPPTGDAYNFNGPEDPDEVEDDLPLIPPPAPPAAGASDDASVTSSGAESGGSSAAPAASALPVAVVTTAGRRASLVEIHIPEEAQKLFELHWGDGFRHMSTILRKAAIMVRDPRVEEAEDDGHPPCTRHWNEEFQMLNENLPLTTGAITKRTEKMQLLWKEFMAYASVVSQRIVAAKLTSRTGLAKFPRLRQVDTSDTYLLDETVFILATEIGFFGGQEPANKSLGLEALGTFHVMGAGIANLHVPLAGVTDFGGFRVLAVAVPPVDDRDTVVQGPCVTRSQLLQSPRFEEALLQPLSKGLNITGGYGTELLALPCDVSVHVGDNDGRVCTCLELSLGGQAHIVGVDLTELKRLFPPDVQAMSISVLGRIMPPDMAAPCTVLPITLSSHPAKEGVPYLQDPRLWAELVENAAKALLVAIQNVHCMVVEHGRFWIAYHDSDPTLPVNGAATVMCAKVIRGDVLVISTQALFRGRSWLVSQIRPELVRSSHGQPVNSDIMLDMSNQCRGALHYKKVQEKITGNKEKRIERLLEKLEEALAELENHSLDSEIPLLKSMMHKAGFNLRHMGALRAATSSPRLRELFLVEMLARAVRTRMSRVLRRARSVADYPLLVQAQLNQVMGFEAEAAGEDATAAGRLRDVQFELKESIWKSYPGGLGPADLPSSCCLFQALSGPGKSRALYRMQQLCGIMFSATPTGLEPFATSDIVGLYPRIKQMVFSPSRGTLTTALNDDVRLQRIIVALNMRLGIKTQALPEGHAYIIKTQTVLADMISRLPDSYKPALAHAKAAIAHAAALPPVHNAAAVAAYVACARLHRDHKAPVTAVRLYQQAIRVCQTGGTPLAVAAIEQELADLYFALDELESAEKHYFAAQDLRRDKLGRRHPDYALTLYHLGCIYIKRNENAKAEPLLQEAKMIQEAALGMDSHEYAATLNRLVYLYNRMAKETAMPWGK